MHVDWNSAVMNATVQLLYIARHGAVFHFAVPSLASSRGSAWHLERKDRLRVTVGTSAAYYANTKLLTSGHSRRTFEFDLCSCYTCLLKEPTYIIIYGDFISLLFEPFLVLRFLF